MSAPSLPLVFLPGAGGRGAIWEPIAKRLVKRRPCLLVDYPGLGVTPAEPGLASLEDLGERLAAGLPASFDLVACSMGCSLALRWALAFPGRVRRLVLVAAAGGVDARRFGGIDWRDAFSEGRPDAPRFFLDDASHFTHELSSILTPTLLIFGDDDLIAPVRVGEFLRDGLANAKLEVVADGTHDVEAEFPDLVASLIEAHLRG
jgi:poly(3-hydroxyoctanoate) depolymerase